MNYQENQLSAKLVGRFTVRDFDTGELIVDRQNAIHPQNCATVIARALSDSPNGTIYNLCFGNGGTFINSSGIRVYRNPNTLGAATLYNQTYSVQVDDGAAGTPTTNSVSNAQSPAPAITSIVTVSAVLNAGEPSGQAVADNITTSPTADYIFDEIGLTTNDGLLLSHLIMSPVEKTANRAFLILYTITVSVS